jgi:hypothetical protein
MRMTHKRPHLRFGRASRVVAALLATMHALVIFGPLAERADSTVAAVHVEQAGTSTHHAHGELCALCAASHLVAPPARGALPAIFARVPDRISSDRRHPLGGPERLETRPRAPPV